MYPSNGIVPEADFPAARSIFPELPKDRVAMFVTEALAIRLKNATR
jgi:hypothetical protein